MMRALANGFIHRGRGQTTAPRVTVLLGVAWVLLACAGTDAEKSETGAGNYVPAEAGIVLAQTSAAPLPLPRAADGAPTPAAGSFRAASAVTNRLPLHGPTAERWVPPTAFFERVSYRTTGPPFRNG